jgi:hypothetical protein
MNNRLAALLHDHFRGLLEFSDTDESSLHQMVAELASIPDPNETSIQRVLQQCPLTRWRLAAGPEVWDGQAPSSSFVSTNDGAPVDAWVEARPLVSRQLISEILSVL